MLEKDVLASLLLSLPGLAAMFTLIYTILKDSKSRRLESYLKAVWGLSHRNPAARSACIFTLQSFIGSYRLLRVNRERQKRVIQVLATHLLTEENPHVKQLCSQAIAASNTKVLADAIVELHKLNRSVWDDANIAALGTEGELESKRMVLDGITDTLILLLKRAGPHNVNLRGVHLDFCDLTGVDLRGCDLTEATISNAILKEARLEDAILNRAIIINSYLSDVSLKGSKWEDAVVCNCRFERVPDSKNIAQQAKLYAGIFDYTHAEEKTNGRQPAQGSPQPRMPNEIYRSRELNWTGIWVPDKERYDSFKAEWRASKVNDKVSARMVKLVGEHGTYFRREESSDHNDGQYIVEKSGRITPNIEYLSGSRTLKTDSKHWDAVRWVINTNNSFGGELRRGTSS
jgi:pentapeptide repeat protein